MIKPFYRTENPAIEQANLAMLEKIQPPKEKKNKTNRIMNNTESK